MPDPSTELQGAIYAALKADAALMALIDDVYDDTAMTDGQRASGKPWGSNGGYITFGPEQILPDDVACIRGNDHVVQLDVWSNRVGRLHCKAASFAVDDVLEAGIQLQQNPLVLLRRRLMQIIPDAKSGVTHGVLQYSAVIERRDG